MASFLDLQERVWVDAGFHAAATRLDYMRQLIRDEINKAVQELASKMPYAWSRRPEASLTLVAGTDTYSLSDYAVRLLKIRNLGASADWPVRTFGGDAAYDENSRYQGQGPDGPQALEILGHSQSPAASGTVTVSENSASVTAASALFLSEHIGRVARINGEPADYVITAVTDSTHCTLDRAVKGQLTGKGYTGTGAGYTAKRMIIGPPGCIRVRTRPAPTVAGTLQYLYAGRPRWLVHDHEEPELPIEQHDIIAHKALMKSASARRDWDTYRALGAEWSQRLEEYRAVDNANASSQTDGPGYVSELDCGYDSLPRGFDTGRLR